MIKSRKILWIAIPVAVVIIGILLFVGIRNANIHADAEETLFGIENLHQTMEEREAPYTILEIVPSDASVVADMGYMIPGFEPALSTLNESTGEWTSWQDGLKQFETTEQRMEYMAGLNEKLQQFYTRKGFQGDVPVVYTPYEESSEPQNGFDSELDTQQDVRIGYFDLTQGEGLRYDLEFRYECMTTQVPEGYTGVYYYADATLLTSDLFPQIPEDAEIYQQEDDFYVMVGTWAELRDTVSGSDIVNLPSAVSSGNIVNSREGSPTVSGNVITEKYYMVSYRPVVGELNLGNQPLYAVSSFHYSEEGSYQFIAGETGNEYVFGGDRVYYKGGFVNNEWFRSRVLNLEAEEMADFPIRVLTLSVAQVNNLEQLPEFDMLYINSGAIAGVSYTGEVDLSDARCQALFEETITGVKPCIVDAAVMYQQADGTISYRNRGTNIFRLCAMFSQPSPSTYYNDNVIGSAGQLGEDALLAAMVQDDDKNFVTEQIYSVFRSTGLVGPDFGIVDIYGENVTDAETRIKGFQPVLDEIQLENQYRAADSSGAYQPLSTEISQAVVVRHIINYPTRRNVEVKEHIRVLEIQPCLSDSNSYDLTEEEIRQWSSKVQSITIDRMTTAEFIGRIEELNEVYDLIYIGTDKDQMNVDTAGNTVFNDTAMNGLVYYHTGDIRYGHVGLSGQLNTDYVGGSRSNDVYYYTAVRYGGNDITVDKVKALTSFLDASYPIVVSDECFTVENDTKVVDASCVDNSSYLYDFLAEALAKERTNFFVRDEIVPDSQLFQFYLNRPKVTMPGIKANGSQDTNGTYNIKPGGNGKYNLQYTFTFMNEGAASADTKYMCQLFIDVNADGKYSESEELKDISITYNGQPVAYNELYAGREYVMTRRVPDGYKGVLPWKVMISQVNNPHIHNALTGYTKLLGLEQEKLEILQISRDPLGTNWWAGDYNETADDMFNLERRLSDPSDVYYKLVYGGTIDGTYYPGIYQDFDINVTYVTISEYEERIAEDPSYLNNFNMLILGFSDIYGNFSGDKTSGAMGSIISFTNAGKSVLFAHDTTSFYNYDPNKRARLYRSGYTTSYGETKPEPWHYAYSLNRYLRDLVGMDRYGILSLSALQTGKEWNSSSGSTWSAIHSLGKDVAYVAGSNKQISSGLTQGYSYPIINLNSDGQSPSSSQVNKVTGQTNKYWNLDYSGVDDGYDTADFFDYGNTASSNLYVTKVNSGQITDYPYKLPDEFAVSHTHAQYYQLDFTADGDKDGQTDLVVWYCLGYRKDGNGNRRETIYSISPNDVSNNYYIYNKGNITYTGVGHAGNESTVAEAMLFINTMIASYNSGIKDPIISTLSDGSLQATEINTVYSYFDESNSLTFSEEQYERAYFTVKDINFVKGRREISLNCYYESADDDAIIISYEGQDVSVKPLPGTIYTADGQLVENTDNLVSGGIYYVEFDKAAVGQGSSHYSIYFEADSTIINDASGAEPMVTGKTYHKLDYTKVHMFDLD